ncbi:MAG: GNAT family N-acetyltransferase, partial [Flavobacteriaceae bacterium]
MKIIPFESRYAPVFKELNLAWLEKYFYVEPKDSEILDNCENYIINKGGYIFFVEYSEQLVGCFSFIKISDNTYELGKMAVDPQFQGKKIGQYLMDFAIDFARQQGWKKIILYSHKKLDAAIYIYKKFGFTEIPLEIVSPYKRSNIKME